MLLTGIVGAPFWQKLTGATVEKQDVSSANAEDPLKNLRLAAGPPGTEINENLVQGS
jgi:hypothetical protein